VSLLSRYILCTAVCLGLMAHLASAQLISAQSARAQPQAAAPVPQGQMPAPVAQAPAPTNSAPAQPVPLPPRQMLNRDIAVLQVLDKVSARTTKLRVDVGSQAAFGLILMTVRSCQVSLPSDTPESAAFLEISEVDIRKLPRTGGQDSVRQAQPERLLFSGWMFASSPALSALEHPTYDVTVLACESRTPSAAERAAAGEEGGPAVARAPAVAAPSAAAADAADASTQD